MYSQYLIMSMNIEINMNVMRRLLYTSITAMLLLGALFSCTDEDYKLYNTSLTNKIYFDKDTFFFEYIIRKSKFPQNPKRSVRFSGKRTKRSVQKRKARNTQKAETKVL